VGAGMQKNACFFSILVLFFISMSSSESIIIYVGNVLGVSCSDWLDQW
jgi:hypothetical protein